MSSQPATNHIRSAYRTGASACSRRYRSASAAPLRNAGSKISRPTRSRSAAIGSPTGRTDGRGRAAEAAGGAGETAAGGAELAHVQLVALAPGQRRRCGRRRQVDAELGEDRARVLLVA